MTALAILIAITLLADLLASWAIDLRLDAIRADLDRIESAVARIADAVGVEDELGDAWPDMDDVPEGRDMFAQYEVTGEVEP